MIPTTYDTWDDSRKLGCLGFPDGKGSDARPLTFEDHVEKQKKTQGSKTAGNQKSNYVLAS